MPFNIKQRTRCAANWRDYPTTFKVYDNTGSAITGECTEAFTFRFDKPEQIVVQLPLSDQGNGELFTAVVNRNSAIVNPTGTSRSPSNPATISSTNQLNQNSFYNYFKYSGKAGEVIHISILLDAPLTTTQKARCSAAGVYSYSTGFRIYNDSYNSLIGVCGTELTYRFNSDDTYIFNFNFEGAGNENGGGIGTGTIYFESLGVRE